MMDRDSQDRIAGEADKTQRELVHAKGKTGGGEKARDKNGAPAGTEQRPDAPIENATGMLRDDDRRR
jgi:hypothetical protein